MAKEATARELQQLMTLVLNGDIKTIRNNTNGVDHVLLTQHGADMFRGFGIPSVEAKLSRVRLEDMEHTFIATAEDIKPLGDKALAVIHEAGPFVRRSSNGGKMTGEQIDLP